MIQTLLRRAFQAAGFDVYRYPEASERLEPHLRVLLKKHGVKAVIDVGANEGQFGKAIRHIDRRLPIHSVEPNPKSFSRLKLTSASDKNWHAYQCALGRHDGAAFLNVTAADDFSSCLDATPFGMEQFGGDLTVVDRISVQMRTLDSVLVSEIGPEAGVNILLKVDTQGFDREVFAGAHAIIERACVIVTEASFVPLYSGASLFTDLLVEFEGKGFSLSGLFPVSRDKGSRIIEADCVFVRNPEPVPHLL